MFASYRNGRDVSGDGLEVVEGGGGGLDSEVDGHEEGPQHHGQAPAYQRQQHVLLGEGAVPGGAADSSGVTVVGVSRGGGTVCWSMGSRGRPG